MSVAFSFTKLIRPGICTIQQDALRMMVPFHNNDTVITPRSLRILFKFLQGLTMETLTTEFEPLTPGSTHSSELEIDKATIYVSTVLPDSSIVYYKLSKGVKKPEDIPDEH